jgi:transcriptional regulator with XRE-family HTH domain
MNRLASRLMNLRALAGAISQRELAEFADISAAYPGFLERSADDPAIGAEIAMRIAGVFGCTVEYLVRGEGEAPPEDVVRAAAAAAKAAAEERAAAKRAAKKPSDPGGEAA